MNYTQSWRKKSRESDEVRKTTSFSSFRWRFLAIAFLNFFRSRLLCLFFFIKLHIYEYKQNLCVKTCNSSRKRLKEMVHKDIATEGILFHLNCHPIWPIISNTYTTCIIYVYIYIWRCPSLLKSTFLLGGYLHQLIVFQALAGKLGCLFQW